MPCEERAASGEARHRPSARSLRGLDGLNFFMADVRDGLGPYLSAFLKGDRGWEAGPIGIVMAVSSVVAAVCQVPGGLVVDATRSKRALVATAGLLIGAACLLIAVAPSFHVVVIAQVVIGMGSAVIPPVLAALSLGIVGRALLPARVSRNESFNHAGNFVAAALAGALGHWVGYRWIFYLVCLFAVASACVVALVRPDEIDHELARGGEAPEPPEGPASGRAGLAEHGGRPAPIREVIARREVLVFLVSVVLFHAGNAAMLPLAGQVLAQRHPGEDAVALSACILAAQLVMIAVAWAVGRATDRGLGRKPIFLVALAVLPVRGVLFALFSSPVSVVAIQLLDGVAAGIFGVISILIASDLMRGTGRFNLAQGLTALATGLGAALSNVGSGYLVQSLGYRVGFLSLTAVALGALVFFALFMPETRASEGEAATG